MKKIIISRTDSIGDVILTLPVAGVLKQHFPGCIIYFLGKSYTRPVIEACQHVDYFLDWESAASSTQYPVPSARSVPSNEQQVSSIKHRVSSIEQRATIIDSLSSVHADIILHVFPVKEICKAAKRAGIPLRIATSHRWYTWLYCNKLVHFSRKRSDLHEAQLNLKMLEGLGIKEELSIKEVPDYYGLKESPSSPPSPLSPQFNLILHPKSKGSAREWGLDNFSRLIDLLPEDKIKIFVTGTAAEGEMMRNFLVKHREKITDLTGKLTLSELIGLIGTCDGLVAASTGPLHIAAALGKHAIGLYAPMKPIHPGRWAPLGVNADYLVLDKECNACRHSADCECIRSIRPEEVAEKIGHLSIIIDPLR